MIMMSMKNKTLIIILGPTAIGKTSLAIQVAKEKKTEIISCDSRQFYKEMCIGTAVPTNQELNEVTHHFIQHLSLNDSYNVGKFEIDALTKLNEIFKKNEFAVMVGGSGMYINAICNGIDKIPKVPKTIREKIINNYKSKGLEWLQEKVKSINPLNFNNIDNKNPQRLIRILEVYQHTGKEIHLFYNKNKKNREFNIIKIGIKLDREKLYERINQRVDNMIDCGLVNEVKGLKKNQTQNAMQTVGYREIINYLNKEITLEESISNIKQNTRRLAKRQITWFKKDSDIEWFDKNEVEKLKKFISKL
tara:strand:- start:3963 stop:4877 length:915 start_codon:yes stop_codon:yes gene_type:complete